MKPKSTDEFVHQFSYDGTIPHNNSGTYGQSQKNAFCWHQLHQKGFPTSGVSTTPKFERAKYYATCDGKHAEGVVLKIDCDALSRLNIKQFVVSEWCPEPSVPEDEEVILVNSNNDELPSSIVVEIIKVKA